MTWLGKPEPLQPGKREQRRVGHAALELGETRLDIAAEIDDPKIGPQPLHLRLASQRGATDHGARRKCRKRLAAGADEGVAHIASLQHRGDDDAWRQLRGQILHGMHGEIDTAVEQRFVDLLGEQALAAEVAQRLVADAVARRGDGLKRDGVFAEAVRSDQQRPHMVRLPQSERASARADQKRAMDQALDSVSLNRKEGIILFNRPGLTL